MVDITNELPATKPDLVVRASYSEDQGMCWSPNKKWIAFHTHADGTDDIWIQSANDEKSGKPLSVGGYETGWPRWSPDGNYIVYSTAKDRGRISKLFLIGIDQEIGQLTKPQKEIISPGLSEGSFTDAHWTADSKNLVVEYVVDENHKEIHLIPIKGGQGRKIHAFQSNQLYSGISLSYDQKWVAYIAPDSRDNLQVFKVSMDGEIVKQITIDATDKAHPAFSPKTNTIAFSVFSYQVIFWLF